MWKKIRNWIKSKMAIKSYGSKAGKIVGSDPKDSKTSPYVEPNDLSIYGTDTDLEAVAKFVEILEGKGRTLSSLNLQEITAIAIGFLGIPMERFYDAESMGDIDSFDDAFLGKIQKFTAEREYWGSKGAPLAADPNVGF